MTAPLVSVLIPAYHERYFGEALASARAQSYPEMEIVVCDDSPGQAIAAESGRVADSRVRHVRNPTRLGFAANFARCLEVSRGELVKFLNDDDRLLPGCVRELAGVLAANPSVRLATSRRAVIDAQGARQPDVPATTPICAVSALLHGRELGDFVLANSINFIGEPSTVMFRRDDLALEDGLPFRWAGQDYHCLADLGLWLRLLSQGLAYYGSVPLSEFRIHDAQEQHTPQARIACMHERLALVAQARTVGFLAARPVLAAALESIRAQAVEWVASAQGDTAVAAREFLARVEGEIGAARL